MGNQPRSRQVGRVGQAIPDQIAPPRQIDLVLAELAGAQYGVFSTRQARDAGINREALNFRVHRQRLFQVHRGVYALVQPALLADNGHRMAAVLAGGKGAALSHLSAAIHTGVIDRLMPQTVDITVPRHTGHERDGLQIHRATLLRPKDIELVYKIPTTTVARTILDLCGIFPLDQVEAAMVEANRMELLHLDQLREQAHHNRRRPQAAALTQLLNQWDLIWSLTETELERMLLQGLDAKGLPRPELQQTLDLQDGGKPIRADFLYRDARLILEADSWRWHAHRFEDDRKRDQRAAAAGYQTLRITRKQVITELDRLTANILTTYNNRRQLLGV